MRAAGLSPGSRGFWACISAVLLLHGGLLAHACSSGCTQGACAEQHGSRHAHRNTPHVHAAQDSWHGSTGHEVLSGAQAFEAVNGDADSCVQQATPAQPAASDASAVADAGAHAAIDIARAAQTKRGEPDCMHRHAAAEALPQPAAAAVGQVHSTAPCQQLLQTGDMQRGAAAVAAGSGPSSTAGATGTQPGQMAVKSALAKLSWPSILAFLQGTWQRVGEVARPPLQHATGVGHGWYQQAVMLLRTHVSHRKLHSMRVSTRTGINKLCGHIGHAISAGADAAGQYTMAALSWLQPFNWQVFRNQQPMEQHTAQPMVQPEQEHLALLDVNTCLRCPPSFFPQPARHPAHQQQDDGSSHDADTVQHMDLLRQQEGMLVNSTNDTLYCLLPADWHSHPVNSLEPAVPLQTAIPDAPAAAEVLVHQDILQAPATQQCPFSSLQVGWKPAKINIQQCRAAEMASLVPAHQSVCARFSNGLYPVLRTLGQLLDMERSTGSVPLLRTLQLPQQPAHVCGRFAVEHALQCIPDAVCCRVWSLEARLHNLPRQKAVARLRASAGDSLRVAYTDGALNVLRMQQSLGRLRSRISAGQAAVRVWRNVMRAAARVGLWAGAQPAWCKHLVITGLLLGSFGCFHAYAIHQLKLRHKLAEEQAQAVQASQLADRDQVVTAANSMQQQVQLKLDVTKLHLQKLTLSSRRAMTASLAMQQAMRGSLQALAERVSEQKLFLLELQQLQKLHQKHDVQERNSIRDRMMTLAAQHSQHLQDLQAEFKAQWQKQQAAHAAKEASIQRAIHQHKSRMTQQWVTLREHQKVMLEHLANKAALMAQEQQARQWAIETDLSNSQTHAAQLADALNEANAVIADKDDMLGELQELIDERGEEVLQLERALRAKEDQLLQLRGLMDQLQENLQNVEERLNSSEAENDQLTQKLEDVEARNVALLERVSALEASLTDAEKQIALLPQFEARMQQATAVLHGLLSKQAETERQLAETEEQSRELQEQLEQSRKELSEARAAAAAREAELHSALMKRGEEVTRLQESKEKQAFLMGTDITALKEEITRLKAASKSERKPRTPLPADAGILQALSCNTPASGLR